MADRKSLQLLLESVLRSSLNCDCPEVHYQPPETRRLTYPCIIYSLAQIETDHADNIKYIKNKRYNITYISRSPDDAVIDSLLNLPFCSHDRRFVNDNLYHDAFTLYY